MATTGHILTQDGEGDIEGNETSQKPRFGSMGAEEGVQKARHQPPRKGSEGYSEKGRVKASDCEGHSCRFLSQTCCLA